MSETTLKQTADALENEVISIINSSDFLDNNDVDAVTKMLLHRLSEEVNTDWIYEKVEK